MTAKASGKRSSSSAETASKPTRGKARKDPFLWFGDMAQHCVDYAETAKKLGRKIVGIMCEYTPREIIMASGAIPVSLSGGTSKMVPAVAKGLPSDLCPLIKSTFWYSANDANPLMTMADLIVAETSAEGKKKMYEILGKKHPMYVLELPQKPGDQEAFQQWVMELRKLKTILEQRFRTTITRQRLRWAIREMNRERAIRRKLAALMKSPSPPITGRELFNMKSLITCMPGDWDQYESAINKLPGRKLKPPAEKRTRVFMTGVPIPQGAEKVMDIIESNGGLVVCQENCTGLRPILEDVDALADDPIQVLAEKYLHIPCAIMAPNNARFESMCDLVKTYSAQCVVELVWEACQGYAVESQQVQKYVEDTLKLPYLRIETDFSPADSARIASKVQALFETVKRRK